MSDAPQSQSTSAAAVQAPPPSPAAPPPRKRRRWGLRIVVALLVFVLILVAAVQVVLWSDIPRSLVLVQVRNALGLRVDADSMQTGWLGSTTLRDVTLALPLADQSMATVPLMQVKHTALPLILLGRPVRIEAVELHDAKLLVQQSEAGRWNVQEALELAMRAAGARQTGQPARPGAVQLPELHVSAASVHVIDNRGRELTIEPVEVRGEPMGPLAWRFTAAAAPQLEVRGEVAQGGTWSHDIRFELQQLRAWAQPWLAQFPDAAHLRGVWDGRVVDGTVAGRLRLQEVLVDLGNQQSPRIVRGSGVLRIVRDDAGLSLQPDGLEIETSDENLPTLLVRSGEIVIGSSDARLLGVRLAAAGGDAEINARYAWKEQAARINAVWRNLQLPREVTQSGTLNASLATPWPGQPQVEARLHSSGTSELGAWDLVARLDTTESRSWNDIDWRLQIPSLTFEQRRSYQLQDLTARLTTQQGLITLHSVALQDQQRLRGSGRFDVRTMAWQLDLAGRSVELPRIADTAIDFAIVASGDGAHLVELKGVELTAGELSASADGFYDDRLPKPIELNFNLEHKPTTPQLEASSFIRGRLWSQGTINGTLLPLELDVAGEAYGQNLQIARRQIGDPRVQVSGNVTAAAARIETTELQLLGATWKMLATWQEQDDAVRATVTVRDLPLAEVGDVLEIQPLHGTVAGQWNARVTSLRLDGISVEGELQVASPVAGEFLADQVTAQTFLDDGNIRLAPITVRLGEGTGSVTARSTMANPRQWLITAAVRDWPLDHLTDEGQIRATIQSDPLLLDLEQRSAQGEIAAAVEMALRGQPIGQLEARVQLQGRSAALSDLAGQIYGGPVSGRGVFDLDNPLDTRAHLTVEAVDVDPLVEMFPQIDGLEGTFSLTATVGPASGPRPLGPIELRLNLQAQRAFFREIEVGDASLVAQYAPASETQRERFILSDSSFALAGGEVRLWGRATRQPTLAGQTYFASQLQIDFDNLQLEPLIHSAHDTGEPYPGLVHGSLVLSGHPRELQRLFGQGNVRLTESNLINVDVIGFLYNRVGRDDPQEAVGEGRVDLRLEAETLNVTSFRYVNRGFEVRATAVVDDIWMLGESPINGTAFGSAQPLRSLRIPFFSDVDRIAEVIQKDAAPVRISGTVGDPDVEIVTLDELGGNLRRMIFGDVRGED